MEAEPDLNELIRQSLANNEIEDDDEIEQEVEQAEVEQPSEPVRQRVLAEYLKNEFKYEIPEDATDEDLTKSVGDVIRGYEKTLGEAKTYREQLAEREKQLAEYLESRQQFDEWRAAQTKAPEKPPEPKKVGLPPLELDEDWYRAAEFNQELGRYVGIDKFGSWGETAASKLNEYAKAKSDRATRLVNDPASYLLESGLEDRLRAREEALEAKFQEQLNAYKESLKTDLQAVKQEEKLEQFFEKNASVFFETGADGSFRRNPTTGQPLTTEAGRAYADAATYARDELGLSDKVLVHKHALREAQKYMTPKQEKAAEKASVEVEKEIEAEEESAEKTPPQDKKKRFVERAKAPARPPASREGNRIAAAANEVPDNDLDFKAMALRLSENKPYLGEHFKGG